MITRLFEIRDRLTFIPTMAILVEDENEAQRYYMARTGYPARGEHSPTVIVMRLSDQRAASDPYSWDDRTHRVAHDWLQRQVDTGGRDWFADHFPDGEVIDVEFILGETPQPKRSERLA